MAEISVEKNSTIISPAQFMTTVQEAFSLLSKDSASKYLEQSSADWCPSGCTASSRWDRGTYSLRSTFLCMPKEPVTPPRPQPAEPEKPPVTDPQPDKDPVEPPPRDPQEDRPMRDPVEPDADRPRS